MLVDYYFLKKKWVVFILINLILIAFFSFLQFHMRGVLMPPPELFLNLPQHLPPQSMLPKEMPASPPMFPGQAHGRPEIDFGPPNSFFVLKDALTLCIPVLVAIAVKVSKNWWQQINRQKEIENQQLLSNLDHLRYQLQPHFFFNALNNIYVLIDLDRAKAKETVHIMSKLMRYLLYETRTEKVKLAAELDFVKQYLSLMRLRMPVNAEIVDRIPFSVPDLEIAPLLFISLVENAHKHGVSATMPSKIVIEISIEEKKVKMIIGNSNFPKYIVDDPNSGIGLSNLKKRLELLYQGRYTFEQKETAEWFETVLEIDLSE
jgi:LytS/YehU family sensor histidine kinase